VTGAATKMGHVVGVAVTAVMLILMIAYTAYSLRNRWGGCWQKYGPLILVSIAFPLIIAEPLRHILQDNDVWTGDSVKIYRDNCSSGYLDCLSLTGWLITFTATYSGFAILFVGSLWNADICYTCEKIRDKWRKLRHPDEAEADGTDGAAVTDAAAPLADAATPLTDGAAPSDAAAPAPVAATDAAPAPAVAAPAAAAE